MGCDIHLYVELRAKNGLWHAVAGRNRWYDDKERRLAVARENGDGHTADVLCDSLCDDSPTKLEGWAYRDRHYGVFAQLAGVRNYWDMAPVSEPRGLPNDVSPEVARHSEVYGEDGHSHSYLTLTELDAADWAWTADDPNPTSLFVSDAMPMLHTLGEPEDVRIVFWFDN